MADVATITTALAPAFAVGFAIQHLNELLDSVLSFWTMNTNQKKTVMGLLSLAAGAVASHYLQIQVIKSITDPKNYSEAMMHIDIAVTALIISTGTEGINSIVKFLGYSKDQKKAEAAEQVSTADGKMDLINRQGTPAPKNPPPAGNAGQIDGQGRP